MIQVVDNIKILNV